MRLFVLATAALFSILVAVGQPTAPAPTSYSPRYTADGLLQPPLDYRQWIYLTSGLDMSYTPRVAGATGMSMFDNVFVNPEAWQVFVQTGTWPDKTMLVLESRGAQGKASINKAGHFQGQDVMGVEVHVKDAARGGWVFYAFDGSKPASMIPRDASCYSCHQQHAAVDTTFVQFYPTLLPIALQKSTLSANYLSDEKTNK